MPAVWRACCNCRDNGSLRSDTLAVSEGRHACIAPRGTPMDGRGPEPRRIVQFKWLQRGVLEVPLDLRPLQMTACAPTHAHLPPPLRSRQP